MAALKRCSTQRLMGWVGVQGARCACLDSRGGCRYMDIVAGRALAVAGEADPLFHLIEVLGKGAATRGG